MISVTWANGKYPLSLKAIERIGNVVNYERQKKGVIVNELVDDPEGRFQVFYVITESEDSEDDVEIFISKIQKAKQAPKRRIEL